MSVYLKPIPSIEELAKTYRYDEKTGNLLYAKDTKHKKKGDVAGSKNPDGYLYIRIGRQNYVVHRVVWKLVKGADPEGMLDHINRITTDNRIENLRLASPVENCMNSSIRKDNSSGKRGARWHKASGKYHAEIQANRKRIHLGVFDTLEEASEAYEAAVKKLHGNFGYRNGK